MATTKKTKKKTVNRIVPRGRIYIHATFNNTIITVTDPSGKVICWSSAGANNFKGSRKGTPFAAQMAAETVAKKALEFGMKEADVFVRGPGQGRETSVRTIEASGLKVVMLKDVTPIPHNGCRPPKRRRV